MSDESDQKKKTSVFSPVPMKTTSPLSKPKLFLKENEVNDTQSYAYDIDGFSSN